MSRLSTVLAAGAFLAILGTPALAGDDAALRAAAERHVRHPVMQATLDSVWSLETIRSGIVAQLQAQGISPRSDQIDALTSILREELVRMRPEFETLVTGVVIETYALEELEALNEFYGTEVGASAVAKSGQMLGVFYTRAAPLFRRFGERVGPRIEAELGK